MTEDAARPRDIEDVLAGDVLSVARGLLGCRLVTDLNGTATEVAIDDVEAYGGADDPASHAYRGRTKRNDSMFREPGTLYVYRSYGVHWCANIVTGLEGEPSAVLLRGGVPVAGIDTMKSRRGRADHLTDGPGKLCSALGITGEHDGTSLIDGPVRLVSDGLPHTAMIDAGPRIGITKATDRPWRFVARTAGRSSLRHT
ncbi:MAG: DNA-3-methyladenine glycosylase [Actinomycetota bacterium]|nr:DNA-3-methyladenine glycosylase [Actinomycetota bacterium]